jgi:uncharacterized protein (TIGR00730 family)
VIGWGKLTRALVASARGATVAVFRCHHRAYACTRLEDVADRRVCVYAGSQSGARADYAAAAQSLASQLAERGFGVVYGGGRVGLMGVLADTAIAIGGEVIGVIPRHLEEREVAHRGLSELRVVGSMHERKALMATLSEAFIALPGGIGTLEELIEMLTWAQLGLHQKPCGLLNVCGYYDPLIAFLDGAVREGFLPATNRERLIVDTDPEALVSAVTRTGAA